MRSASVCAAALAAFCIAGPQGAQAWTSAHFLNTISPSDNLQIGDCAGFHVPFSVQFGGFNTFRTANYNRQQHVGLDIARFSILGFDPTHLTGPVDINTVPDILIDYKEVLIPKDFETIPFPSPNFPQQIGNPAYNNDFTNANPKGPWHDSARAFMLQRDATGQPMPRLPQGPNGDVPLSNYLYKIQPLTRLQKQQDVWVLKIWAATQVSGHPPIYSPLAVESFVPCHEPIVFGGATVIPRVPSDATNTLAVQITAGHFILSKDPYPSWKKGDTFFSISGSQNGKPVAPIAGVTLDSSTSNNATTTLKFLIPTSVTTPVTNMTINYAGGYMNRWGTATPAEAWPVSGSYP